MNDFPQILDHLLDGNYLSGGEAQRLMDDILQGGLGPERLAALVAAMRAKSPAVDEIVGFARAMREHGVHLDAGAGPVLDNCGTGGATCKAFNVSTTAAFALAGAGIKVAKHGNRSVTRPSGSADVLERAGVRLDLPPERVQSILNEVGIAFLFAPAFHPAMKHAGPVRAALGIKTVFNLLGPLTNPAGATHQVLGVYEPAYLPLMGNALARLGCEGAFVLHGRPGFDEATPCGPIEYVRVENGEASRLHTLDPTDLAIPACKPDDIAPVPADKAADLMGRILAGDESGPRADTVALNVALGLAAVGKASDLWDGIGQAKDLLLSGAGKAKLDAYVAAAGATG